MSFEMKPRLHLQVLGHSFDRVPGTKSCLETIKPHVFVSQREAHRQAAARVNGDGAEVACSILICLESEGKKKKRNGKEETDGNESLVFWSTIYPPQQLATLHAKASSFPAALINNDHI